MLEAPDGFKLITLAVEFDAVGFAYAQKRFAR